MQELFKAAVERGASDIHIKAGDFMRARIHGELQPLTQQKLTVEETALDKQKKEHEVSVPHHFLFFTLSLSPFLFLCLLPSHFLHSSLHLPSRGKTNVTHT